MQPCPLAMGSGNLHSAGVVEDNNAVGHLQVGEAVGHKEARLGPSDLPQGRQHPALRAAHRVYESERGAVPKSYMTILRI